MSAVEELELLELWPTLILSQTLPGHQPHTERLGALAGSHPEAGVFALEDASVEWLKAHIAHGVNAYLREFGAGDKWAARGWFEILHTGEYQSLHSRPEAALCGIYMLQGAAADAAAGQRDDLRPGALSFYDPRPAMNMNAINDDPYQRYQQTLPPSPGLLVIWSADLRWFAHPNLAREPLARIAFDIFLPSAGAGAAAEVT